MQPSWTRFLASQPGRARTLAAGAAAVLLLAAAAPARADAPSAAHNFFGNLARAGSALDVTEQGVKVDPTLVRGIYAMYDAKGGFVGFINEPGTLFGDARGWSVLSGTAVKPRQITPEEKAGLRVEIMGALEYDKLVKVSYGDGGGRKLVLFSAVDCGFCQRFEQDFAKNGGKVNTTFYVVPSSLKPLASGAAQWQAVSHIWCAENNGAAWKTYWSTLQAPPPRQCAFDPATAERAQRLLSEIFRAAGVGVYGTPTFVREDGGTIDNKRNMDEAYMSAMFGRDSAPRAKSAPRRWLVAAGRPAP